MATAPNLPTWRHRLCAVIAGLLVAACDLIPLAGGDGTGGRTPVETVTALEVDVEDVRTDPAVHVRHGATSRQ
jgi:hypothetical protein